MARDLYGEMLSRALNRGAPPGHFPAYINPGEAAQLRAQGGGVPPGDPRGQYVANGLPSYQSPADWQAAALLDYAPQQETVEVDGIGVPVPRTVDLPEFAPSRRDVAAAEVARLAALPQSAVAPVPVPAVEPAGPPAAPTEGGRQMAMGFGYGQGSPEYALGGYGGTAPIGMPPLGPPTGEPASVFIERRERDAAEAVKNAQDQNAVMAERRAEARNQIPAYLTGEDRAAAEMEVWRQYPSAVNNRDLSVLNLAHIEAMPNLSLEERSELLDRDIPKGGVGWQSFGAGAYRRGVERGFWEGVSDFDQMRWVEYLNQPSKDGGYAVADLSGSVSMPKELMALGPALAGSAASFILPPAAAGALTLGSFALGKKSPVPGLFRWGAAKYPDLYQSVADSPLGDILRMRGDSEERALPGVEATQRILRRQPDSSQPYVGAPDVPIAEPPFAPPQSVTDEEEDAVEGDVEGDGERTLDPISRIIQDQLRLNRELGEEQRRLAQALIPRQFA
jgi:hypothetical protein